jgi:hypothetical protein
MKLDSIRSARAGSLALSTALLLLAGACGHRALDNVPRPAATDDGAATTPENPAPDGGSKEDDAATEDSGGGGDATIPPGATLGSCDRTKWTVLASDSLAGFPTSYATDELAPTRWTTGVAQAPGQYLQIDFGGYVILNQVTFDNTFGAYGQGDYPRGFDVLASADAVDFSTQVASHDTAQDPGATLTVDLPATALRAVRLRLNWANGAWWSIHDLRLGCSVPGVDPITPVTPSEPPDPTTPANPNHPQWAATASHTNNEDPIKNAIDGNPATRWSSGKGQWGDEWFRLDLGQETDVSQIWLDANSVDYPAAYEVELSTDDVTYSRVSTGVGKSLTKIGFPTQRARYLRLKQIGTGYESWWSIHEISVYP